MSENVDPREAFTSPPQCQGCGFPEDCCDRSRYESEGNEL
jgi:hypothetical protein